MVKKIISTLVVIFLLYVSYITVKAVIRDVKQQTICGVIKMKPEETVSSGKYAHVERIFIIRWDNGIEEAKTASDYDYYTMKAGDRICYEVSLNYFEPHELTPMMFLYFLGIVFSLCWFTGLLTNDW